jgi:hypothetical protein
MRLASRRVARVVVGLLGLAALSAASVSHCFKPGSVGGSCLGGEMLCFEEANTEVKINVVDADDKGKKAKGTNPKKVLALMGTVERLEKVQAKIEALSGKGPALTGGHSKGAEALAVLNGRREKTQARVAKQLKQLGWDGKGVCMNMDLCKEGTFVPTEQGDAFENISCYRYVPAQPGEEDEYVCERMVGIPATLPAIKCNAFFHDNQ